MLQETEENNQDKEGMATASVGRMLSEPRLKSIHFGRMNFTVFVNCFVLMQSPKPTRSPLAVSSNTVGFIMNLLQHRTPQNIFPQVVQA